MMSTPLLLLQLLLLNVVSGQDTTSTIWINEFHYDNTGTDKGEFIEIAGISGTDLSNYAIYLYNGASSQRKVYDGPLSFASSIIPNQQNNIGTAVMTFSPNGIQNGDPDGMALIYTPSNTVIQFISYGGSFMATDGPAVGKTSVDIEVEESSSTAVGTSLQLIGIGKEYDDFVWKRRGGIQSPGEINECQTMITSIPTSPTNHDPIDSKTIWINELHYDNQGTDTGEFIEIAGKAGTDLSNYYIYLYNGDTNQLYDGPIPFCDATTIPNQMNNVGTAVIDLFSTNSGIQNGDPDGIALVYSTPSSEDVVQFISYSGTFTASEGPAAGQVSTDIGVSQDANTPIGTSLGLEGKGNQYDEFVWAEDTVQTPGQINVNQIIPNNNKCGYISTGMNYLEAEAYCVSTCNSHLSSIITETDIENANTLIGDGAAPWIGLHNVGDKVQWFEFYDGSCPYPHYGSCVENWIDAGYPKCKDKGGYDCTVYYKDMEQVGNDKDCHTKRPFLCGPLKNIV